MRIYNILGYLCLITYLIVCGLVSPTHFGIIWGVLIGAAYLATMWFLAGLYLSDIIHMGITHRALNYKVWFIKVVTFVNNTFGIYVDPVSWTNRHRLHHKYADFAGDPNKLSEDGFWKTLYLCLMPYKAQEELAKDEILKSKTFKIISNPAYAVLSQVFNFCLLTWLVSDWKFAAIMWLGTRIFALWVNMIQNFWTHDRRFGYRRYDDTDNAMNIGEWLPVTATFSACLQNNHHHNSSLLRLSHDEKEYDFGFMTVRFMKSLGLVQATETGSNLPSDNPLKALNF